MDMMRTLQENVAASRSEQERMHEALVASQARNEELNRINEGLRKALQEREERAAGDKSWLWLKHKENNFCYSYAEWVMNPLTCIGSIK